MIVLSCLQSEPSRRKTFIANRVSEIQSILSSEVWNHIRGKENPADCVSRDRELRRVVASLRKDEPVNKFFADENIRWKFNPPAAPHSAGLWEAAIKSAKLHLKRTIGTALTTIPKENLLDEKILSLKRWKLTQQLFQNFWKRWSIGTVSPVFNVATNGKNHNNVKLNDLVLLKDDNIPPYIGN
ncbi:hypothetical protein AVEN_255542-1 [Araneus ventricosus]|uniref:DUF5641 domain-containing protein n=1 Tax=Araneus ventricosus TaxID=182803 RepID=A0A4Y2NIT3_ARAVE|nr:hypothetical protein AVEN_255542-1 [Araneus ventricosus]